VRSERGREIRIGRSYERRGVEAWGGRYEREVRVDGSGGVTTARHGMDEWKEERMGVWAGPSTMIGKPARKKEAEMGSEDDGRSEMSVWQQ
jgi:hypothetical protein